MLRLTYPNAADLRQHGTVRVRCCTLALGRGLNPPHRVKSISMTTFTQHEIEFLQKHTNEGQMGNAPPRHRYAALLSGQHLSLLSAQAAMCTGRSPPELATIRPEQRTRDAPPPGPVSRYPTTTYVTQATMAAPFGQAGGRPCLSNNPSVHFRRFHNPVSCVQTCGKSSPVIWSSGRFPQKCLQERKAREQRESHQDYLEDTRLQSNPAPCGSGSSGPRIPGSLLASTISQVGLCSQGQPWVLASTNSGPGQAPNRHLERLPDPCCSHTGPPQLEDVGALGPTSPPSSGQSVREEPCYQSYNDTLPPCPCVGWPLIHLLTALAFSVLRGSQAVAAQRPSGSQACGAMETVEVVPLGLELVWRRLFFPQQAAAPN
ncbi:unnamed protein product [Boreogadus saida]